jgi:hypothetical protein
MPVPFATSPIRSTSFDPVDALTHDEVAERAYLIYLSRGEEHGQDVDDWLEAERELLIERADQAFASLPNED